MNGIRKLYWYFSVVVTSVNGYKQAFIVIVAFKSKNRPMGVNRTEIYAAEHGMGMAKLRDTLVPAD